MLVVNRFRVAAREADALRTQLEEAHALLATKPGYVDGTLGRLADVGDSGLCGALLVGGAGLRGLLGGGAALGLRGGRLGGAGLGSCHL